MRALFWIPVALPAWAQLGYGQFPAALRRLGALRPELYEPVDWLRGGTEVGWDAPEGTR